MSYRLDWRGWPQGWDRTTPFRAVNFLGKTSANTHQTVITRDGHKVYLCRRGDTRVLEVRFVGRVAYSHAEPGKTTNAYVDWPHGWQARKGEYTPHPWKQVVRQALQITII